MARTKSRFTQADVTKLIKAARGTGFECVSIEVLPGNGGLRATYAIGSPKQESSALEEWKTRRAREKVGERAFASAAGKDAPIEAALTMSDEEWSTALRASELTGRERMALEQLFQRRGLDVPHNEIKGAGIATQRSLQTRGYALITMDGDRFISWRLTDAGERFHRQVASLPPHL